ncbi:hypothetical protein DEU56DRAFT_760838 [Suillus clintonianus]|uniref:uncharacterized protein n=1 Tax=Suillus clintonianus TaxID=1904413 RepID=UPI001B87F1F6|nr:uncharacterized protein DEU56DRAFT_760838 [Suillus clintonianus]KAG2120392.1 hypothetical protein DEU56DRAFT_760838 [Suillus clintonianus]
MYQELRPIRCETTSAYCHSEVGQYGKPEMMLRPTVGVDAVTQAQGASLAGRSQRGIQCLEHREFKGDQGVINAKVDDLQLKSGWSHILVDLTLDNLRNQPGLAYTPTNHQLYSVREMYYDATRAGSVPLAQAESSIDGIHAERSASVSAIVMHSVRMAPHICHQHHVVPSTLREIQSSDYYVFKGNEGVLKDENGRCRKVAGWRGASGRGK